MSSTTSSREKRLVIDRLKAEGDAAHRLGDFQSAYFKYSEAIKLDVKNAVLYSNRAASSFNLKEYLDSACDAKMAVALDPKYSKAWARLAKAAHELSAFDMSIEAWEKAVSTLLHENLTPTEQLLKGQYESGLNSAQESKAKMCAQSNVLTIPNVPHSPEQPPWVKATEIRLALAQSQDFSSSAWVIWAAYMDFENGMQTMKNAKIEEKGDKVTFYGTTGAISDISNGILRDPRVFHMDSSEWFDRYNRQVSFEGNVCHGWVHGGAKAVKEDVVKRLKVSGWDSVRPALAITVRAWILNCFFQRSGHHSYSAALEFIRSAYDVLEWGRKLWKDVPSEDRGTIFENTFIIGVKRMFLSTLMDACGAGDSASYSQEDLAEMAHDLIDAVKACPRPNKQIDPGFHLSFWVYPIAEALSVLGWFHMQTALSLRDARDTEAHKKFEIAAAYYTQAAETYPVDDEYHIYFLKIALEAHWWRRAPLRVTLPLCKRIRLGIPAMEKIWKISQLSKRRDESLKQALGFEEAATKQVLDGTCTLDDFARPQFVEENDPLVDALPCSGESGRESEGNIHRSPDSDAKHESFEA